MFKYGVSVKRSEMTQLKIYVCQEVGRHLFGPQTLRKINSNGQKMETNYEGLLM